MDQPQETYGARLYAALRNEPACHRWLNSWHYDAIQRLKQADRDSTVKMFLGSRYDVIQQLKASEPEAVAQYLAEQANQAAASAAVIVPMIQ